MENLKVGDFVQSWHYGWLEISKVNSKSFTCNGMTGKIKVMNEYVRSFKVRE